MNQITPVFLNYSFLSYFFANTWLLCTGQRWIIFLLCVFNPILTYLYAFRSKISGFRPSRTHPSTIEHSRKTSVFLIKTFYMLIYPHFYLVLSFVAVFDFDSSHDDLRSRSLLIIKPSDFPHYINHLLSKKSVEVCSLWGANI